MKLKRIAISALTLIALVAFTLPAFAGGKKGGKGAEVASIDDKSITVKSKDGQTVTYAINEATVFEGVTKAEIAVGDKVQVTPGADGTSAATIKKAPAKKAKGKKKGGEEGGGDNAGGE